MTGSPASYLSLDIGGTKCAASVVTGDGVVLAGSRIPTRATEGPQAVLARIAGAARAVMARAGAPIARAGISVGGPLDPITGTVDRPPNLPGWDRVPLRALIADAIGLPPDAVAVENDANASALAEHRFGAARGLRHVVFLTMSTGIGAGVILDGRIHRGASAGAGEVGHQVLLPGGPPCGCGARGCFEALASGAAIARRLREDWDAIPASLRALCGGREAASARHVVEAARGGDAWSRGLLEEIACWTARGLAHVVFTLNPERIILGTIAFHAGALILDPIERDLRAHIWPSLAQPLSVVATPLGPRLEALSGLAAALEAENPDNGNAGCPPPTTPP